MKKTILVTTMAIVLSSFLGACAMNDKDKDLGEESRDNMTEVNYDNRADRDLDNDLDNNLDVGMDNQYDENARMDVADEAADKVTELKEVEDATVIVTDNNAYVAAKLEGGENMKLTKETEEKIADKVRNTDPDINDVFVSTNPDFLDRMNEWADEINKGNPVTEFIKEFNDTIRRIFPTDR
ncbi:YhcN/YlaJ family sporulation lipoprotein [Fictibacillus phosphorivorans]|uniref:YhcN/YlaJ family sporulation lipoprotein n=1 Tax=Fictibacillus phosphorivorans TaxID=1221500 RepID=UPI00203F15C1|nr:YhcN/YlaJ family sporulation lipoprotein [Fictibacillus phosphorivorans]MCM3718214.1 YhcN/YlaJ family sporulation lipoprotein [Fictibacillus phosphorivorans]MCM3775919.1 YhcN/YlaJ family sporulation lipoprotein [Fictibacillus phosphorivorans]